MTETPTPPPAVDIQDPLPEANWLWRRVFTFVVIGLAFTVAIGLAIALNRIVGNVVGRIDTMDAINVAQITVVAIKTILQMFQMMFWTVIVVVLFYMIAPSAEQITKMIQTAGLLKHGVQIAQRAVETGDRREVAATVGLPPQPIAPPAEAPAAPVATPKPSLPDDMPVIVAGNGGTSA